MVVKSSSTQLIVRKSADDKRRIFVENDKSERAELIVMIFAKP